MLVNKTKNRACTANQPADQQTTPADDIAISVKNLTKTYRIFGHPGDRIKQAFTFGRMRFHREFTALQEISFEIRKGETVGIIGRNGSGKSTLLQLICGILKPTSGDIKVNGRISALLELGAGFNPEFTGRENVYFQGAIMGIPKEEMDTRFDEIVAFADIGEFIDQPVRIYSSGMYVRLAFSVAISVDPDILVVDEALAVGDALFQAKCFQRIEAIRIKGVSILLVTHSLEQVAHFCDRALLLNDGKLIAAGDATETLTNYINRFMQPSEAGITSDSEVSTIDDVEDMFRLNQAYNSQETRWGDLAATITNAHLIQRGKKDPIDFFPGLPTELWLHIRFHDDIECPIYGLAIKTPDGAIIFSTNSQQLLGTANIVAQNRGDDVNICFTFEPFLDTGNYLISVGIASETDSGVVPHDRRYDSLRFRISHPLSSTGCIDMRPSFYLQQLKQPITYSNNHQ